MQNVHFHACVVLAAGVLTWAPNARAGDDETTARLTRQIAPLVTFFQPDRSEVPIETLVDSLTNGKTARTQLFRLESLLRLYQRAFPDLERYRRTVKELEDALGDYAFATDSVTFARSTFNRENETRVPDAARKAQQEKILAGLEKKRETARRVLTKRVETSTLGTDLPRLHSVVASRFAAWTPAKDLAYVKVELHRLLKDVRDGRFDFDRLEDGIHEFRRRLRWFPVLIDSLDGLILLKDDPPMTCPVPALTALARAEVATHRYSNPALRFPATRACTISRCLLWQVVKTTNDIGNLKDEVQGNSAIAAALDDDIDVAVGNDVSAVDSARARAMRTEILSSRALDSLMTQLSFCQP
jgi:hypothetical protein